jgi:hypothetical protein
VEFHCNTDLKMEAFWLLILIPFGFLVTLTYGVPTIVIPLYYAIKHKILTLLGKIMVKCAKNILMQLKAT